MSLIQSCLCGSPDDMSNAGRSNCLEEIKNPRHLVIALRFKANGDINSVDPAGALDQSVADGLFRNDNPLERYYIIENVKNFTPEQADDTRDEAEDGTSEIVAPGAVTHNYRMKNVGDPAKMAKKLLGFDCFELMAGYIDDDGNFVGQATDDQKLTLRLIEPHTWNVRVSPHTSGVTNSVDISFQFEKGSENENVDYISKDQWKIDLRKQRALIDANTLFVGVPTQTGGTVDLSMDWGGLQNGKAVEGFSDAEIDGFNKDTDSIVAMLTFDENPNEAGEYDYTHASQSVGNIFSIRGKGTDVQKDFDCKRFRGIELALVA